MNTRLRGGGTAGTYSFFYREDRRAWGGPPRPQAPGGPQAPSNHTHLLTVPGGGCFLLCFMAINPGGPDICSERSKGNSRAAVSGH